MIELARRRMMMGGSAKPYDAEVEYLESTGTQWIDTGIAYNIDNVFSFDVDSEFTTSDTNEHLCTIGTLKKVVFVGKYLTEYYTYVDNGTRFTDTKVPLSTHHIIVDVFPQSQYRINGVNYTTSYYFTDCNGMSLPLFARRNDFDSINPCHAKVRHFAIYKDGINVRDFIPVRKGNIGYLYDKVSGRLFGNQGTGSFIVGPDYDPFAYQYLTFVPLEDSTFSFSKRGTGNDIEYSIDGGAWTSLASGANTPTVGAGHNIRWKGQLVAKTDGGESASSNGVGNFVATGNFKVCGNVMSLIYEDNFVGQDELLHNFQFSALLSGRKTLISAKDLVLPAMTLTSYCYYAMFYGCINLTDAPELPATSLPSNCYRQMFNNCTSLVQAPSILPGTPSSPSNYYHYFRMFKGCTSLVTAPVISSTRWGHSSCSEMFYGCTSLVTVPALSATTLQNSCYANMFYGCTSLTTAPELPATTLATTCYRNMYYNCSNLTYVKMLATNISDTNCLEQWVSGVSSTGTFVKNAAMTTLPTGSSGIPSGWTVVDDPSTINS